MRSTLIALNGDDLRREPLTVRKHMEEGETVFVQPVGWVSKASSGSGGTRVSFPALARLGKDEEAVFSSEPAGAEETLGHRPCARCRM
jgi:hypothetical protein